MLSEKYDDFAVEMEQVLDKNKRIWQNEEQKVEVIPELEFGQNPELWKT